MEANSFPRSSFVIGGRERELLADDAYASYIYQVVLRYDIAYNTSYTSATASSAAKTDRCSLALHLVKLLSSAMSIHKACSILDTVAK